MIMVMYIVQISSLSYALAFSSSLHPISLLWRVLYDYIIDYLLVAGIATAVFNTITNTTMRCQYHSHSVEQRVEWMHSFDIHSNAYLCYAMITYVIQVQLHY